MQYLDTKRLMKALHVDTTDELLAYMFDPVHQDERIVREFLALYALVLEGGDDHAILESES